MPSPFPGMDPWLEDPDVFPDFHSTFIHQLRDAINSILPPPYYTAVSTRVWLEGSQRHVEPDVDVFEPDFEAPRYEERPDGTQPAATAMLEITATLGDEEFTEPYLDIRRKTREGRDEMLATIELLSLSNKTPGSNGRDMYKSKQQEMYHAGVHILEIDLHRGGTHSTLIPQHAFRSHTPPCDYHTCLVRGDRRESFYVIPIGLPDRLPVVTLPVAPEIADLKIDLQAVFLRTYESGKYHRRVKYRASCQPPLSAERAHWAEAILAPFLARQNGAA